MFEGKGGMVTPDTDMASRLKKWVEGLIILAILPDVGMPNSSSRKRQGVAFGLSHDNGQERFQ